MRARVDSTNASSEPIRIGSGSTIDAMPAIQQPRTIVISARLVGPRMATWSPGTRPLRLQRGADGAGLVVELAPRDVDCGSPSGVTEAPTKRTPVGESAAGSSRVVDGVDDRGQSIEAMPRVRPLTGEARDARSPADDS